MFVKLSGEFLLLLDRLFMLDENLYRDLLELFVMLWAFLTIPSH